MAASADQLPVPTTSAPARREGAAREPEGIASRNGASTVSLDELLDAHWRWKCAAEARDPCAPGRDPRSETAAAEYVRLYQAFEDSHGVVLDHFFGSRVKSAVVLTADYRVRIRYPAEAVASVQPEFEEAVWRATALAQRSRVLLGSGPTVDWRALRILAEGQQSVLVYLLGVLDSLSIDLPRSNGRRLRSRAEANARQANGHRESEDSSIHRIRKAVTAANCDLDRLDDYTRLVADRVALRRYLLGLPLGVIGLVLVAIALALSAGWTGMTEIDLEYLLIPLVTGGVGALISVMTRVSSGDLNVAHTVNARMTFLAGVFRPLLGAVFGVALYVLLKAGLLPFVDPPPGEAEFFFFAGVGFLAGFSERWAQDQIVQTASAAERSQSVRARRVQPMAPAASEGGAPRG